MDISTAATAENFLVHLNNYAIVSTSATIQEAVLAQEKNHSAMHYAERYKHRIILVENEEHEIVGKITEVEIIRSLEPEYNYKTGFSALSRYGYTSDYLAAPFGDGDLWSEPLHDICRKSASRILKDIMRPIRKNEFVEIDATLNEIIHRFVVVGKKQLFVRKENRTIGVIRLHDVFIEVCLMIKTCPLMGAE